MNKYEIAWCLCTIFMLFTGCAALKEWAAAPETQDTAVQIATDAATGNWPGVAAKVTGLGVACLLAVLGIRKVRAVRAAK